MSSGPELPANHGWVHRPKEQGGTDPVPAPNPIIPWMQRTSSGDVTVATPWADINLFLTWQSAVFTNDTTNTYFEKVADGGGIGGIKIKQAGYYLITYGISVWENNATDVMPTRIRVEADYANDLTGGGTFDLAGVQNKSGDDWATGATNLAFPRDQSVGGTTAFVDGIRLMGSVQSNIDGTARSVIPTAVFPVGVSVRMAVHGATADYKYGSHFVTVSRLGNCGTSVSQT